jgi:hypothetical protein
MCTTWKALLGLLCTRYHHNVRALGSNLMTYMQNAVAECRIGGRGEDSLI